MRKLLSTVILLFASVCAWGQGATVLFPPAVTQQGNFLPFAKITFCTTPATLDTLGNCTNIISVFKDQALTQPYSSAILTDGIGYFPPNANTATSLWFTPAANLCFTLTTSSMISPATNPCTPFSVAVTPGSSPTFAALTVTGPVSVQGTLGVTGTSALNNTTATTLTVSTSETVTQPTFKTGANQLNQGAGLQIFSIDDWSRIAVFGTGIISGKWTSISGPFPEGNDNPIMATGPADIPLRHIDLSAQCTAAITAGSEQNCPLQLPAPIAGTFGATANNSGGTLAGATTYFIKATWTVCTAYTYLPTGLQNPTCTLGGETTASPEVSVVTPTCAVANTCSITVTFVGYYPTAVPDVYPGVGAYSLYSSTSSGAEKLMIANHDIHSSYTMTAVGAGVVVPASNTASFPTSILASNHNGITLERGCDTGNNCGGVARTETLQSGTLGSLTSGQYAVNGANAIHVFTTKAHPTTPWEVSQVGSTIFHGDNEVFMCDKPLGAGGTGHNPVHTWQDSSSQEIARIPCDTGTGNIYPDWTFTFDTPITGKNGATSDVVVRSYKLGSFFRVQSFNSGAATGTDLFTVNDNGAVVVPAGNFSVLNGIVQSVFKSVTATPATAGTFSRMASSDTQCYNNNAGTANLCLSKDTNDIANWAGIPTYVFVTADQTITAGAGQNAIPGLTWTLPANAALKVPFSCHILYSQATAAASDSFGIQDVTVAPTNLMAKGQVYISASTFTAGNLPALASTTATAIVTFTPSAPTTVWNADLDGFIEQPSNASTSAVNITAQFTTNNGTIKRGSYCRVF